VHRGHSARKRECERNVCYVGALEPPVHDLVLLIHIGEDATTPCWYTKGSQQGASRTYKDCTFEISGRQVGKP
jgi:hypothetical protein